MANPSFSAQTQGRTAMPPVALRLRAVFPPFRHALHPRHTYYLRCLSTRLDLAYFRGHARTSVFGPCAMGEPLVFGPNARPNSHAAPSPSCPSPKAYVAASVSFHTLGLSSFPRPWPNLGVRPARHGEPLVFSPGARPNGPAARRRAPPPVFPPFHLALQSRHAL